jgi:chromosomal replication initiator protein
MMHAWQEFVKQQENQLGKEAAEKWLRPLKVIHFDSANLYLEAIDSFQILWFEEHIRPLLKTQLLNNNFRPIKVHITLNDSPSSPPFSKPSKKESNLGAPPLPFFYDKLDPLLTLENFIPGKANQVLFHLLCELSGHPTDHSTTEESLVPLAAFNPIFLWGTTGSGKTHLLMALTQTFKKRGLNALYARAETFTEHVVSAIRSSEMQSFRKTYRHVDVLLIDDIHLFARKDATQEEFFHTFNTLYTSSRQIILSSKCPPSLLREIEPRLVSRFEWGINIHLEKLEEENLMQVLQKRCEGFHFPLRDDVSSYLVHSFPSSKSLHKALEALILRCHLEEDARHKRNSLLIDLESAKRMLADLFTQQQHHVLTPEKIISTVSAKFGIRVKEDLLGSSQSHTCSLPRQIAMYLCRQELKLPFQAIGRIFLRDHSTVMASIKQIEKKIEKKDKEVIVSISEIITKIESE